ncbi:hypothetical protein B5E65_03125 [Gemmiger sp. An120]|uniref:ABC-2 transporter permease n=1 Tax=Gemmiger TaxID=204475 RepID=UPI000B3A4BCC|nr:MULTISPECIES: ABC-2 transporter permease [Gemmiger]MBM6915027.1 ABC-2 transporter permease [Gemmiger formicilis]OUQ43984.1 hypothetical protein B5E65_03125 [Gemmiger sp. An120]
MKGLFLKDWYGLLGMYKKNLLLVLVLYAALSMILNMPFFLFMTPWLLGFYTLSSFSLDESCRWNLYARTLPVSSRQIVGGKFLLAISWILPGTIYAGVVGAAVCLLHPGETLASDMAVSSVVVGVIAIDMISILLAMTFRAGVEKARSLFFLIFIGFFLIIFLGGQIGMLDDAGFVAVLASIAAFPLLWALGALAVAILIPVICFSLSCRIYANKEF